MAKYNVHAGHCPQGQGAHGAVGILKESVENRKVKDELIKLLRAEGNTVYDCTVNYKTTADGCLAGIVKLCNAHSVALDVSIHLDAGRKDNTGDGDTGGCSVLIYNDGTKEVATRIAQNISKELGIHNRGVILRPELYVLRNTNAPAILVECCFVDDADDAKKWSVSKCAKAIAEGILNKEIKTAENVQNAGKAKNDLQLYYRAHVQSYGTLPPIRDGQTAGTTGLSKRLEAFWLDLRTLRKKYPDAKLSGDFHVQRKGWVHIDNIEHDTLLGTTGEGLRLEAFKLYATGLPDDLQLRYEAHIQGIGWQGVKKAGEVAGTEGESLRIESIRVWIE